MIEELKDKDSKHKLHLNWVFAYYVLWKVAAIKGS